MHGNAISLPRSSAFTRVLDRVEEAYLKFLRAMVLFVATLLIVLAAGWATISLIKVLRSPNSVEERLATVGAQEITSATTKQEDRSSNISPRNTAEQRRFYDTINRRYYAFYQNHFAPYRRTDDKQLSLGEFDDLMLNSEARLTAIRELSLDFSTDKQDVETFLKVVSEAGASQATKNQLLRYKNATKQRVASDVTKTRTERRRGWDPYSEACEAWYEAPIGCAVTRSVTVPYTEKVYVMRYPNGVKSPNQLLKTYQDRYFDLLATRRDSAQRDAASERENIVNGQVAGWAGLSQALILLGVFVTLMFFFLLIAIERHQRNASANTIAD